MWGCKNLDPVLQVFGPCIHGCYGYRGSIYTWICYESVHVPRENRPRRKKIVSIQILQAAPAPIDQQLIRSGLHLSSRWSINLKRLSAGRMIDVVPMDAHFLPCRQIRLGILRRILWGWPSRSSRGILTVQFRSSHMYTTLTLSKDRPIMRPTGIRIAEMMG